jgi:hypothetical protein
LRRRQEDVQQELKKPGVAADKDRLRDLLGEFERINRALRDPRLAGGLAEATPNSAKKQKTA